MKYTKLAAAALASVMMLSACGQSVDNPTVMTVGDTAITESEFNYYMNTYKENYNMGQAKKSSLEYCQKNQLVVEVAKAMNVQLDSDTEKKMKEYKKSVKDNYEKSGGYKKFLKDNNLTDEYIDTLVSVGYYTDALKKQMDEPTFTDDEMREYFKEHYRRVKYVLISTIDSQTGDEVSDDKKGEAKKTAEEVLEKAQNGEDFDTLISDYSPNTASDSDDNGYIFTDNETGVEFEEGTDSINAGEFTLVQSDSGYYVIEKLALDETQDIFDTEYDNVADEIAKTMQTEAFNEQVKKWADEYGIKVTVNQEVLDKIN